MLIRLPATSDLPLYQQIADAVVAEIDAGRVTAGEKLPAARHLAAALGVNMHTVLKAYAQLDEDGIVEVRRGRQGVTVRDTADALAPRVRAVVEQAKRGGVSQEAMIEMIREAW